MKVDIYIGLDSGKSNGGIVWWDGKHSGGVKMPEAIEDIHQAFIGIAELKGNKFAVLEGIRLRSTDFMGGKFKNMELLVRNNQTLIDCLIFYCIPYKIVYPTDWQTYLRLKKQCEEGIDYTNLGLLKKAGKKHKKEIDKINYHIKQTRKKRYKAYAQKYFPDMKQTDWSADAFCLVNYIRLKQMREPDWFSDAEIKNISLF